MTLVNIIGSGHMAGALARRMIAAREPVTIIARDGRQARDLVEDLGPAAGGSSTGEPIDGHIVVLAVPYSAARTVITDYGSGLDGKIVVDISNPVDYGTFDRLTVPAGASAGEEIAALLEGRAEVVKAFNTTFAGPSRQATSAAFRWTSSSRAIPSRRRPTSAGSWPLQGCAPRCRAAAPLPPVGSHDAGMMGLQVSTHHERFKWDTAIQILP